MEWIVASLLALVAALICVVVALARRQSMLENRQQEQLQQLSELQSAVCDLRQQLEVLQQVNPAHVSANSTSRAIPDPLESIERLADTTALANADVLKNAANQVGNLPAGLSADLFESDEKLLAISHLIDHGHSLTEVARRLHLTIGEVELLASLRS